MRACMQCPNKCGARPDTTGVCGVTREMRVAHIAPHFFEEPPISGTKGSGTVFFAGCNMRCVYCQNHSISRGNAGKRFSARALADAVQNLEKTGVHNINFVTPSHYAAEIRETLTLYRPAVPVVYNTSGYDLPATIRAMRGYVQIYLPDYKYADASLAKTLSGREDYPAAALAALKTMREQVTDVYDKNGLMRTGMLIRHLVLPGQLENTFQVLESIAKHFPNTGVSLMSQFTPMAETGELSHRLKPLVYKRAVLRAERLGITPLFTQALSSADEKYIPAWSLFDEY